MATTYGGHGLGGYGRSSFDEQPFANTYATPGWQRAQQRWARGEATRSAPHLVEGEMTARETEGGGFARGERIFHQKFGYGRIRAVDGNKLVLEGDLAYADLYKTNVRVSEYQSGTVNIKNGTVQGDQNHPTWNEALVSVRSTVNTHIDNVTVRDGNSMG